MTAADAPTIDARAAELAARLKAAGHFVTLAGAVSESTAAEVIGVSRRTLRTWRQTGEGPRCYDVGRVLYPLDSIVQYLDAATIVDGGKRQGAANRGKSRQT
jgi:hypothetical protein